jgi:TolB-like protein
VAPGDEVFTRHVGAVLVVERDPDPAAPDAAGDDAIAHALALLRRTGDAEPIAAGALAAGFDTPAAAVTAANGLHREYRVAGGPRWRAGIDVGEVLMTPGDAATREAIERATALARLARPGTTAVAAGALPAIGAIRDATVEALAAPHTGHLIVPRPVPSAQRRRLLVALAGTTLAGAGTLAWLAWRRRAPGDRRLVTLGVGPFGSPRVDPEHAWIGNAVRTGLNTQLSELSDVKVYSQAFIDFVMRSEGLSDIEVATRLGIDKMLSGSVLVVGDSVQVEAQIIDVASGLLEGSYATVGREQDFLALENQVVLGIIARLELPLSPEDERRLAARRESNPDAFRRFLDTEGAGAAPPAPSPHGPPSSRFVVPREAYAADAEAEVAAALEDYRRALEAGDVAALGTMYLAFLPAQRAALERYFASVRDLRVRIADVDIAVVGGEGVVSYTRVDDFVDVETRRPQHLSLRVSRTLRRVDDRWRFAGAQ